MLRRYKDVVKTFKLHAVHGYVLFCKIIDVASNKDTLVPSVENSDVVRSGGPSYEAVRGVHPPLRR